MVACRQTAVRDSHGSGGTLSGTDSGTRSRARSLTPAAIVVIYATVALLYIVLSDRLLGAIVSTPEAVTRLQSLKGAVYVALTAALLYVLLARWMAHITRAEDATRRSEARLRVLLEQMPAVVWSADRDLRITSLRGAGLVDIGLEPDEHVGSMLGELQANGAQLPVDIAAHQRALAGESVVLKIAWRGHTFECHLEPYRDPDGEIAGVIGLATDISERARAEQLMAEQEALLRQAQKMEAVGRLAGGLGHDFNNLLTIITTSAEFLDASLDRDDERRTDIAEIRHAGDRAAALVRELLAFSRQQLLHPAVLDLHDVFSDARPLIGRTITAHVELRLHSRPGECIVMADQRQLEMALINLAVNARDAMPKGGGLTISAEPVRLDRGRMLVETGQEVAAGAYALIRVRDTGHGMDAATRARIFEPFFSSKGHDTAGGLGLAVVYGVVAQSGGYIDVESEPGRGAEFRIYLPLAEVREEQRQDKPTFPPPAQSATVLLAEDEDVVRRLARRVLEREGFTVLEARDGEEALELCEAPGGRIDIVVSDVVMPRIGGRALVERCLARFPECRALLISGYVNEESVRRDVLESGAAFLRKPYTPDALVRKVRESLETPVAG